MGKEKLESELKNYCTIKTCNVIFGYETVNTIRACYCFRQENVKKM